MRLPLSQTWPWRTNHFGVTVGAGEEHMMITFWGVLVVLGVLLVARYGADGRPDADPMGREHTRHEDAALLAAFARRVAAHRRCWELFDRSLRPWESQDRHDAPR